jgi:hypothetical protein
MKWLRQRFKAMDAAGRVGHAARHMRAKVKAIAKQVMNPKKTHNFRTRSTLTLCSKCASRDTPRQSYSIPLNLQTQSRSAGPLQPLNLALKYKV